MQSPARLLSISVMAAALCIAVPQLAVAGGGLVQQKTITKDVKGFAPPKLDYAKICEVQQATPVSVNVNERALSPERKLRLAVELLRGGPGVFPQPTRAVRLLREVMETKSKAASRAKFQIARLYLQGQFLPENQDKAVSMIEEIAPSDPYEAGFVLARLYQHTGRYSQAEQFYKRSALAGNPLAYISRAYMYRDGLIADVSQKKIDQLVKLAEGKVLEELAQGKCASLQDFGKLFLRDTLNEKNLKYGVQWLQAAAKAQTISAMSALGHLYLIGMHVEQSTAKGLEYYQKGAAANDAESLYRLGQYWMFKEPSAAENRTKAAAYLDKAAQQGHQAAIKSLTRYYQGKYGDEAHYEKAVALMTKALAIPDIPPEIPFMLGEAYVQGDGVEKNEKRAFELFDKAAKMNFRDAMLKLGDAYKYGIGVKRNPIKSYRFYRQAAMVGSRDSMIALVENYQCGVGKPPAKKHENVWRMRSIHEGAGKILRPEVRRLMLSKDPKENEAGFLLLKRRAAQEDREARVMLSHFYRKGIGTKKNEQLAESWLKEALIEGDEIEKGYGAIGEAFLDEHLFGVQPLKAIPYLEKAMKLGSKDAGYELGKLYAEGAKGVPKNLDKAMDAFRHAAKRRNDNAMRKLADLLFAKGQEDEAIKLLDRSASMHNIDALLELVNFYTKKPEEDEEAMKQALYWHKKAREHYPCEVHTKVKLDRLTAKINARDKTGMSEDPEELLQLAKEGNARAMRKIAQNYIYGSAGMEPDPAVAFEWYVKAAKTGDALAMMEIGNAYSTGLGVEQSRQKAREWWERSAKAGNKQAKRMLAVDPKLIRNAPKKKVH